MSFYIFKMYFLFRRVNKNDPDHGVDRPVKLNWHGRVIGWRKQNHLGNHGNMSRQPF